MKFLEKYGQDIKQKEREVKPENNKTNRKFVLVLILLCLIFGVTTIYFGIKYMQNTTMQDNSKTITQLTDENLLQQFKELETGYRQLEREKTLLVSNSGNNSSDFSDKQKEIEKLQQDINTLKISNDEKDRVISNLMSNNQEKDKTITNLQNDLTTAQTAIKILSDK